MTDTARITYRWFDRNNLGEPLPVVRHGIGWTHDIPEPPANAPTHPELPRNAYPFESVITENRLQWKDLRWFLPLLAISCFAFAGFIDFVSWLRGIL